MLHRHEFQRPHPNADGIAIRVRITVGIEVHVEAGKHEGAEPHGEQDQQHGARPLWTAAGDEPWEQQIEERLGRHGPGGRVPKRRQGRMPSLQQQRGKGDSQAKVEAGVGAHLLRQHTHGEQQTEGIDGIEAGEARGPKAARGERAALGALGIVIGENETGKQQEKADGNVSAVDHRTQRSKRMRIGKMEEHQVEGGKTADAGEGRQL